MVSISTELLMTWISTLLWPLTRILGLIASSPLFSHKAIPMRIKISLGILITLIIAPTLPPLPSVDIFSLQSLSILMQQLLIGVAMGFTMRIVFAAIEISGTLAGMTMGLGFASFFDPQSQGQTNAVTQFVAIISILFFLSINGHLVLLMALVESFFSMPISLDYHSGINMIELVTWGEKIFSAGLHLALPIIAVLLLTNLALGVLSRAAPQLNLFGIGFPVTIGMGFIILALTFNSLTAPLEKLMFEGIQKTNQLVKYSVQK